MIFFPPCYSCPLFICYGVAVKLPDYQSLKYSYVLGNESTIKIISGMYLLIVHKFVFTFFSLWSLLGEEYGSSPFPYFQAGRAKTSAIS